MGWLQVLALNPTNSSLVAGLTLPESTLTRLRTVGIWCDANLTVQRRDQEWLIRGQEAGGAVNDIGRYVSFCKEDGSALRWLQPVKNFMPNGLHAVLLTPGPIVRLDVYRFETSYDLLITSHTLVADEGTPKPKLETKLIFFHRFGVRLQDGSGTACLQGSRDS